MVQKGILKRQTKRHLSLNPVEIFGIYQNYSEENRDSTMAEANKITVQVKTPKDKKSIVTSEDAEIKDVSKLIKIAMKIVLFTRKIHVDKHVTAKASYKFYFTPKFHQ